MRISDWSSDVCSSDLLKDRALIAEEAARDVMGVSNSEGAGASAGRTHIALATSHGFSGSYAATSHGCYASVLAGEGSGMQRDYASHTARHLSDLEAAASIGLRAGQRAVARLNPVKIERSEEHTSELQSLMRNSYAVFCLKKKKKKKKNHKTTGGHSSQQTRTTKR